MKYNLTGQFRDAGLKRHRGGLGDVVMALGVAERLAKKRKGKVTFGCPRELISLGENVPGVEVLPCRPTDDIAATPGAFDRVAFGKLWDLADAKTCFAYELALQPHVDRNRSEIWAQKLGLKGKIRPRLYLTDQERAWGRQWVSEQGLKGRFLLGIVHKSARWGANWQGWVKLLYRLRKKHPFITPLFFSVGVRSWEEIELATVGIPIVQRPLREMLTILNCCHLVAGVDTGPMHAAASLGRPTLWVFTHIDGSVRTRGYKRAQVVQRTDLPCTPCWYEAQCAPPSKMPCKGIPLGRMAKYVLRRYRWWKFFYRLRYPINGGFLCFLLFMRMAKKLLRQILATGSTFPKTAG